MKKLLGKIKMLERLRKVRRSNAFCVWNCNRPMTMRFTRHNSCKPVDFIVRFSFLMIEIKADRFEPHERITTIPVLTFRRF